MHPATDVNTFANENAIAEVCDKLEDLLSQSDSTIILRMGLVANRSPLEFHVGFLSIPA